MMVHSVLDDDALDRAALFALGCLAGDEASVYDVHLAGCGACRKEVESLRRVVGELSALVEAVPPASGLRERLLQRLARDPEKPDAVQAWKHWTADAKVLPLTLINGGSEGWEDIGVAGISVKRLFVDPQSDRATMLVRMAPGTSYPAHRHGGAEECYVLEGDITAGPVRMHAGDYMRATPGSIHETQSTEDGCLLFIVSSLHDEILSAHP